MSVNYSTPRRCRETHETDSWEVIVPAAYCFSRGGRSSTTMYQLLRNETTALAWSHCDRFDNDHDICRICWQGIATRKLYLGTAYPWLRQEVVCGILFAHLGNVIRQVPLRGIAELEDPRALCADDQVHRSPASRNDLRYSSHDVTSERVVWPEVFKSLCLEQVHRHHERSLLVIDLLRAGDRPADGHTPCVITRIMVPSELRC